MIPFKEEFSLMKKFYLAAMLILTFAFNAFAVPSSFSPVVKKAAPSVVNISTTKTVTRNVPDFFQVDPFFQDFFGGMFGGNGNPFGFGGGGAPQKYKSTALGSGFIIDTDGYIVTNNHVIEGADEIIVKLHDDREFKAEIVGTDPLTDLALLKINPKGASISPILLGDSDRAEIGDWVVAIGNPLGLGGTVTAGILSAKGRVLGDGPYDNFIQTDVSINPGNSGGPLINMDGEVIGINTAIIQSAQGLGFAVPVNMLKNILPKLKKDGKVSRGWVGIVMQPLDEQLAASFGLPDTKGVLVADVTKGEPGDKAGLKAGDVIVAVDGKQAETSRALAAIIGSKNPNERIVLTIIREGKRQNITVKLGERPDNNQIASTYKNQKPQKQSGDIQVKNITPEEARELGISNGVIITSVNKDTQAFEKGLKPGLVIVQLNNKPINSEQEFYRVYNSIKKGDLMAVKVVSPNGSTFIAFAKSE